MKELSDTEDYQDSRKVLSIHNNEVSEAFNNSIEKESLEVELLILLLGLMGLQPFHQPPRETEFICFQQVANDRRLMVPNISEGFSIYCSG
jgi:hypothetical protein